MSVPIADVLRGGIVESRHRGIIAIADADGTIIHSCGNIDTATFLRSSAKPFQAIPLLASGAAEHFQFNDREIAIACGSHNGQPIHTETVQGMLNKIGVSPVALLCGTHEPFDKCIADADKRAGREPTVLQNNCSGKHAGMLAAALKMGEPIGNYISAEHRLQKDIRAILAAFAGLTADQVPFAIDGCGVPTFALSIRTIASMFARFAAPATSAGGGYSIACDRIFHAMTTDPEMVAGRGEFDTELMTVTKGRILSKSGAEGMWCAALRASQGHGSVGIALKVEDGSSRARAIVALQILKDLQLLNAHEIEQLGECNHTITNRRGLVVGEIRPIVRLD